MSRERFYRFLWVLLRVVLYPFYPLRIRGREKIPEGAAVICANHSSNLDPLLISFGMGKDKYVHHFAKEELRHVPLVGMIMTKVGSIFVKRGESDIDAFKESVRVLKAGEKIILFPEGTRVRGDENITPKTGVVRMAARTGVPVVPVYLPRKKKLFHPMPLIFGDPYMIHVESREDYQHEADALMERIWDLKEK